MFRLLTSIFMLLVIISGPAFALPGQTLPQLRQWVKNHAFLPPELIQDTSMQGAYWVKRELTNGKAILFYAYLNKGQVVREDLYIEVHKDAEDKLNLFDRDNPSTERLINLIYGSAIAADFKASRFIYEGFLYYVANVHNEADVSKLRPPERNNFFQNKYFYCTSLLEANSLSDSGETKTWTFSLIASKSVMQAQIANLEKQKKRFQSEEDARLQKEELARQQREKEELLKLRTQPADIDI